jgi:hypothetical protein
MEDHGLLRIRNRVRVRRCAIAGAGTAAIVTLVANTIVPLLWPGGLRILRGLCLAPAWLIFEELIGVVQYRSTENSVESALWIVLEVPTNALLLGIPAGICVWWLATRQKPAIARTTAALAGAAVTAAAHIAIPASFQTLGRGQFGPLLAAVWEFLSGPVSWVYYGAVERPAAGPSNGPAPSLALLSIPVNCFLCGMAGDVIWRVANKMTKAGGSRI